MADLTTVTRFKEFYLIGDDEFDPLIADLIRRLSVAVERFCNRKFKAARYTENYSGEGSSLFDDKNNKVFVKNPPIVAVASLHDSVLREFDSTSLIATDDYVIHSDAGILELDGNVFAKGLNNIQVIYTGGYTDGAFNTDVGDVEQALLKWVAIEFKIAKDKLHGKDSITKGDVIESMRTGAMPDEVKDMLKYHRLESI